MRFEVSERVETTRDGNAVLRLTYEQFQKISDKVEARGDVIVAKSIEATFGSINRSDETEISIRRIPDGWLIVADVYYKPSAWFWVLLLVLLFTYIGWLFPIAFYLIHKGTVRSAVENALRRVANELRETSTFPREQSSAIEELERLANLKERGFITDEEFASKKAKLLGLA